MQRLTVTSPTDGSAPAADPLGASDTSRSWTVSESCVFLLSISGTWSGNTATLQHSPTGLTADFIDYAPEGTAVTFTANDIRAIFAQGQKFRIVTDSTGSPALHVHLSGDGVTIPK